MFHWFFRQHHQPGVQVFNHLHHFNHSRYGVLQLPDHFHLLIKSFVRNSVLTFCSGPVSHCVQGWNINVSLKCYQSTRPHTNLSPPKILPGIFAYSNKGKYWWANILADSQINISIDSPLTLSRVSQCPPGRITLPTERNVYYDLGGNQFSGLFDLSQIFIKTY